MPPTLKTQDGTQLARVGTPAGTAPAGFVGAENDGLAPLCDNQGHLFAVAAAPNGGALGAVSFYDSAALETSAVILAAPGDLAMIYGFNNTAALAYFQVFDKAAVPVAGDVPLGVNVPVPANGTYSISLPFGKPYATGIAFGFSTTPAIYTAAAAGAGWVNAQYRP